MTDHLPWTRHAEGLVVALRVTPRADRDAVQEIAEDAAGRPQIRLKVTAAPEDGKANAAVQKLLAKKWGLARSRIDVISGATSREKRILVRGDASELAELLRAWAEKEFGQT